MSQRGFTLLEVLVAALALGMVLLGASTFFLTAGRFGQESSAQAFLQRQATMIKDEMATQIQAGSLASLAIGCGGVADSVRVTQQPSGDVYCFKRDASPDGTRLLEDRPGGGQWDLLEGAAATLTTTTGACPASGGFCPSLVTDKNGVTVAAAITLRLRYRSPGTNNFQTMTFTTTITPRNP